MGLSSCFAFSSASSPHGYQSTGLCACWSRYGLVSLESRLVWVAMPSEDSTAKLTRNFFPRGCIKCLPMSTLVTTPTDLVARLKARDKTALEDLVREHGGRLYGVALQIMRNETDAQEAVQDALITIWNKIDQFEGRSAFTTWLQRVTANAALMRR